jgi:hypothetical protein
MQLVNFTDTTTILERQRRLRDAVEKWATQLADDDEEETLSRPELEALVGLCEEYFLPVEAARVRRWLARV